MLLSLCKEYVTVKITDLSEVIAEEETAADGAENEKQM
jgi:hypothetical protein